VKKTLKKFLKKKKGFTLVELLIVVTIISILAGAVIPNFMGARTKAQVVRAFTDMDAIAKAEEMYYMDHIDTGYTETLDDLTPTYIQTLPTAPWDDYRVSVSSKTAYVILNDGPDDTESVSPGTANWDWTAKVIGAIGGSEGVYDAYGLSNSTYWDNPGKKGKKKDKKDKKGKKPSNDATKYWYNPASGATSAGDIGYGGG